MGVVPLSKCSKRDTLLRIYPPFWFWIHFLIVFRVSNRDLRMKQVKQRMKKKKKKKGKKKKEKEKERKRNKEKEIKK